MTVKTLFEGDSSDLGSNPAGPKTHSIRAKPFGITRLNHKGIVVLGGFGLAALIIATMTFPGSDWHRDGKQATDNGHVNPKGQWYTEIPDTQPIPNLAEASAPVLTAATAPKEAVPVLPKDSPQQVAPPPPDPAEELRRQQRLQAMSASLVAPGFQIVTAASHYGSGEVPSRNRAEQLQHTVNERIAARTAGYSPNAGEDDDQNKQAHKEQFLKDLQQAETSDYHTESRKQPISPYEIKAGTIIPSVMIGGINSDLPGQLIAQVRENVYDTKTGQYVLIPQGSRVVGLYDSRIAYGQQRLLVAWTRIIYPDGSTLNLKGMPGADAAGYAGLSDEVDNHYFRIFGSAILMSAITAGVQLTQGGTVPGPLQSTSPTQLAISALGQQLGQTGAQVIQKNMNVQPTITVRNGQPFNIIVTADLILPLPE
ncbi:conjugal transfer protein TrbI [Methylocaldum sp. BRCS4]|nr:conjugal transfer protein TrbI [Methylocaldum sp. BRCS4]